MYALISSLTDPFFSPSFAESFANVVAANSSVKKAKNICFNVFALGSILG